MNDAKTIADEMLRIGKENKKTLTPLQLMKLVYIAHGWSLGLDRGNLYSDQIEAWRYGPIIPELYNITKKYGRDPIPVELVGIGPSMVDLNTSAFLRNVFSKYGHLSGLQLSNLTHKSGTPWDIVCKSGECNSTIPNDLISGHYRRLLHERLGRPTPDGAEDFPSSSFSMN